jgi:hypothetical protein
MRTLPMLGLAFIMTIATVSASSQTIQVSSGNPAFPSIAIGATRIAVVWQEDGQRIDGAVLDFFGNIVTPRFEIGTAADRAMPRVAAIGDEFLVAWYVVTGEMKGDIRSAVFDTSGVMQTPVTLASSVPPTIVVAGGNTRFLVSWFDGRGSRAAWINVGGVVESNFDVIDNAYVTDVAVRPDGALAAWSRNDASSIVCGITAISTSKAGGSRQVASMTVNPNGQSGYIDWPAIAWNGSSYFLAWVTSVPGVYKNVEGTRLTLDGTPLDVVAANRTTSQSGGTLIDRDIALKQELRVSVVGDRFLVSWGQSSLNDPAHAHYIDQDGRPSGSFQPIPDPRYIGPYFSTTTLPDGTPVSVCTRNGVVEVDFVRGGQRRRAVR